MNSPYETFSTIDTSNSVIDADSQAALKAATVIETTLIPHTAFQNAGAKLDQCFRYAAARLEPICVPVIGESRTGKSRSLEVFSNKHPMVRTPTGMLIPVLRVITPSGPTKGALAETMLAAMGDEKFAAGTLPQKTIRLFKLLKACDTRVVIIDEFQQFIDKASERVAYETADWLKNLVDEAKVALVVAGLPSCLKVLDYNEQLDGRFLAPVVLPRFDWATEDSRDEFVAILSAFEETMGQHFKLPALASDEMSFRFYCASGGLIGYLSKMLRLAVWNADEQKCDSIDLPALQIAYEGAVRKIDLDAAEIDPFSPEFSITPSVELLMKVHKIGTREAQGANQRGGPQRKPKLDKI